MRGGYSKFRVRVPRAQPAGLIHFLNSSPANDPCFDAGQTHGLSPSWGVPQHRSYPFLPKGMQTGGCAARARRTAAKKAEGPYILNTNEAHGPNGGTSRVACPIGHTIVICFARTATE